MAPPPRLSDHAIYTTLHPGRYGDRPEPWQREYFCICGEADLGFDEEGRGSVDVEAEFAAHLTHIFGNDE